MSWFKREDHEIVNDSEKTVRTEGLWIRCPDCGKIIFKADLEANQQVCPHCGHHFRIDARTRIENLLEPGYEFVDLDLRSTDPLEFTDLKPYKKRLAEAQKKTGLNDAIINAVGQHRTAQRRPQRHGVQLHRRLHGLRSSAKPSPAPSIARSPPAPAHHRLRLRRSAHDGGHRLADAARQDLRRARPARRRRRFPTSP